MVVECSQTASSSWKTIEEGRPNIKDEKAPPNILEP